MKKVKSETEVSLEDVMFNAKRTVLGLGRSSACEPVSPFELLRSRLSCSWATKGFDMSELARRSSFCNTKQ